jgi:hypothetical protein
VRPGGADGGGGGAGAGAPAGAAAAAFLALCCPRAGRAPLSADTPWATRPCRRCNAGGGAAGRGGAAVGRYRAFVERTAEVVSIGLLLRTRCRGAASAAVLGECSERLSERKRKQWWLTL